MSWNDGYERKKFRRQLDRQTEEYRRLGMTEEQIAEIVAFDEEQYRRERTYQMHTQTFCESNFDDEVGGDDGQSPLYALFPEQLTVTIEEPVWNGDLYGWLESIETPALYIWLKSLSEKELLLITLLSQYGMCLKAASELAKVPYRTAKRWKANWKKFFDESAFVVYMQG